MNNAFSTRWCIKLKVLPVENGPLTRYNIPDYIRRAYTTSTEFTEEEVVPSYNHFARALSPGRRLILIIKRYITQLAVTANFRAVDVHCARFDRFSEER